MKRMNRTAVWILSGFIAGAFMGCASSHPDMLKEMEGYVLPGESEKEPGKAMIYVVRPSGLGALIRFNIFVDDVKKDEMEAGNNRGSQYFYFNVGPGVHKLFSVAENTAEMELAFKADSTYFIQQDTQMGLIMARNSLTVVEPLEGKYDVKKTSPGTFTRKSFP